MLKHKIKKIIALALTATMMLSVSSMPAVVNAAEIESSSAVSLYNGFGYTVRSDQTVGIWGYAGNETDIVIPDEIEGCPVVKINDRVFANKNIKSVVIPDSVTYIGSRVFENCYELESVSIGKNVAKIYSDAFNGCYKLTQFSIHEDIRDIDYQWFKNTAYYNNSNNWENGVLYIDNHLIKAKDSVSGKYEIKDGTKSIGVKAFEKCFKLTEVTMPEGFKRISNNAFNYCYSLESVKMPSSLMYIGVEAFLKCIRLNNVTIPDNVTRIHDSVFFDCWNLESITLSKRIMVIGNSAFKNCSNLSQINIPNAVTSIGSKAFSNCKKLKDINIPKNLNTLKGFAFAYCSSLTDFTIPDKFT